MSESPAILVIDIGTTGLRAAIVDATGSIVDVEYRANPPSTPFAGLVEFDAAHMAALVLEVARVVLKRSAAHVIGVGITNQRASTVVWDRATGVPVGPGLGWQDLRTVMECITARSEHGLQFAPNQTATKAAWMLKNYGADLASRARDGDICIGTIDSWIAWTLSQGALHVTDHTNAAVTGLVSRDATSWSSDICDILEIPIVALPKIVASSQELGQATALNNLPITALVGDQQASLVGQGCITPGRTKITFGTGGMLDMYTGTTVPSSSARTVSGTFPIVAFSLHRNGAAEIHWGVEAIMLSAGTNIEWLRDDMGLISSAGDSELLAASVDSSDGVTYVPALFGLGTPHWDYGARGSLFGLTRGSTRAHVVRSVLEGVAHRGADLYEAASAECDSVEPTIRIDGGMSQNRVFVEALANATGANIEVSPVTEATTLGAAFLAGTALSLWPNLTVATSHWAPQTVVAPSLGADVRTSSRAQWQEAVTRTRGWIPALSALDF